MQLLIKEPTERSHMPDLDQSNTNRHKNEIKLRVIPSDEGVSTVLFDALQTTSLISAPCLLTNDALSQIIRRERLIIQLDPHDYISLI